MSAGRKKRIQAKQLSLQRRIYRSLQAEAEQLMGEPPAAIRRYARECARDFSAVIRSKRSPRPVAKNDLIRAIRAADISCIADFHTFAQAQRSALRLMREAIQPGEDWCIGLELLPSHHQKALDRFQAGEMTLEKFHQTIHYREEWGFPWSNYAPLFEWAREHRIRLIALNQPKEAERLGSPIQGSDLHARDRWAAGVLTDLLADAKKARIRRRIIVLYGELHVGMRHLPHQIKRLTQSYLKKRARVVSIHQNHDELYWRLARDGRELETQAVRLMKDCYCIISSPPWVKLQSLVTWAEGGSHSHDEDHETDDFAEASIDHLALLRTYGNAIVEFLGGDAPSYESLTTETIESLGHSDLIDSLKSSPHFNREELTLIRSHVEGNHRLYVPKAGIAYLGTPSHNSIAELAAIHLLREHSKTDDLLIRERDDFFRVMIESAFAFFGSLILNPRRKCDLPKDHQRRIRQLKRGAQPTFLGESEARLLAIAALSESPKFSRLLEEMLTARSLALAVMMAARFAGQVLGRSLHQAVLEEKLPSEWVRSQFLSPPRSSESPYESRYDRVRTALKLGAPKTRLAEKASKLDQL